MKSDVYFSKVDSKETTDRALYLKALLRSWDPFVGIKSNEIVPVKITVGDRGNKCFLKPEMVKVVADELKSRGLRPFLFDTNVIYPGERQNAVDHLNHAYSKGFTYENAGAPFIVADGLFGLDNKQYAVSTPNIDKVKVPTFVGMLDNLVVLSHTTGHILAGYGGAVKNIAMGMSSRAGKQTQHSSLKPHVVERKCTGCGTCVDLCPEKAISMKGEVSSIDKDKCVGCGECIAACRHDAIYINWKEDPFIFSKKMVETTKAIMSKFKQCFFINFAIDITKDCDCMTDIPGEVITGDAGIFASSDIVSVEKATLDAINKEKKVFAKGGRTGVCHRMIDYAAQIGMGNLNYEVKQ
ncbi:DUF362 domain-containing protein [Elusimicrobiota bacterium]